MAPAPLYRARSYITARADGDKSGEVCKEDAVDAA
jgi:hypothetical protein